MTRSDDAVGGAVGEWSGDAVGCIGLVSRSVMRSGDAVGGAVGVAVGDAVTRSGDAVR